MPTTTIIVIHICVLPFFFANVRFAARLSVAMRAADGKSNTRQDKEAEPLMPVATATPMT